MIKAVLVYITKGKQFDSFKKAVAHRENLIEEFLRKSPGFYEIGPKGQIALVEHVLKNRKTLMDLLDYEDVEPDDSN